MEQSSSQLSVPIVGAWRLRSFEIRRDDGGVVRPFGAEPEGSLIYTESRRYSAQVMRPDRPMFASGDQMKGTPQEVEANYTGVVSYYGRFDFDPEGGFVVHHVERSLFPNWEGEGQKRFFDLDGDVPWKAVVSLVLATGLVSGPASDGLLLAPTGPLSDVDLGLIPDGVPLTVEGGGYGESPC